MFPAIDSGCTQDYECAAFHACDTSSSSGSKCVQTGDIPSPMTGEQDHDDNNAETEVEGASGGSTGQDTGSTTTGTGDGNPAATEKQGETQGTPGQETEPCGAKYPGCATVLKCRAPKLAKPESTYCLKPEAQSGEQCANWYDCADPMDCIEDFCTYV